MPMPTPMTLQAAMVDTLEPCRLEILRIPFLPVATAHVEEKLCERQVECRTYADENGVDLPEVAGRWFY